MGRNGFEDEEYTRVVYLEYIEFEGTNNLLGEKSNILVVNQVLQCQGYMYKKICREEIKKYTKSSQSKMIKDKISINILLLNKSRLLVYIWNFSNVTSCLLQAIFTKLTLLPSGFFLIFHRYPFALSKSSMYTVGAPHTWPHIVAALVWLIDCIKVFYFSF